MTALFPQINEAIRLEVMDITMSRGDNVLFQGLSTTIVSSDILWIQGNNGIGKTTLLEALAGLSRPDTGQLSWMSAGKASSSNQLIAYQPHKSYVKATLSAKEDLQFWARIHKAVNLVDGALDYVGLLDKCDVLTQVLSAGQKRRLALAKLIISQKPIWIMDEPSAAMDIHGIKLIDKIITEHINRGGIAIIASHDSTRKLSAHTRKLTLKAAT